MANIDEQVLNMKMDTSSFDKGVNSTLSGLDKLKNSLKLSGGTKGLNDVQNAANKTNFSSIMSALEGLNQKFSAFGVFAATVISNVTNRMIQAGINMAKSMTVQPMMDGFGEYETKMGSIQTILANTSKYGTKLADVSSSLNTLNNYADKTIYSFSDMTRNIGYFTNAGLNLKESTSMIQGFSNAAAASGTTSQGAAGAAYQLSQALSAGTIRLMDWRSLTNVGMGNKNMQNDLIMIANAMGEVKKHGLTTNKIMQDFNGSLEKGWLSADVMSKYLQIMAGDIDSTGMKALGLNQKQIEQLQQEQKTAEDAATKVRTLSQLFGTIREAIGSGWAQTFEIIFGNFDEATDLFTSISDSAQSFINDMDNARNSMLQGWKDMGGRSQLIASISLALNNLGNIVKSVGAGFSAIFKSDGGAGLKHLTDGFSNLVVALTPSQKTLSMIKDVSQAVFSIFKVGISIISGIATSFGMLFSSMKKSGGSFTDLISKIAKLIINFDDFIIKSGIINKIIVNVIGKSLEKFGTALGSVSKIFSYLISSSVDFGTALIDLSGKIAKATTNLEIWSRIANVVKFVVTTALNAIGRAIDSFKKSMQNSSGNGVDMFKAVGIANAGMFAIILKKLIDIFNNFKKGSGSLKDAMQSIASAFTTIPKILESVKNVLVEYQKKVKASSIKKIAEGVALLAGSIFLLARLNWNQVAVGLAGMAGLLSELTVFSFVFNKLKPESIAKGSVQIIALATAALILSGAIKKLSDLSWEQLLKGLTGTAAGLGMLVAATIALSKSMGKNVKGVFMLGSLAVSMRLLAESISKLSGLSWEDIAKGLTSVAFGLGLLSGAAVIISRFATGVTLGGLNMLLMASALFVLSKAIDSFKSLSWGDLVKGLTGAAAGLAELVIATRALGSAGLSSMAGAAGMLLAAFALKILTNSLTSISQMSWGDLIKGLVGMGVALAEVTIALVALGAAGPKTFVGSAALAVASVSMLALGNALKVIDQVRDIPKVLILLGGALLELVIGLNAMQTAIPGSLALFVSAHALVTLGDAFKNFASISWDDMLKALGMMGVSLLGLAVAAVALAPVTPAILALDAALGGLGLAMMAIGGGIYLISFGLTSLASLFSGLAGVVQPTAQALIDFISTMVGKFAEAIPQMIQSGINMMMSFLNGVLQAIPNVVPTVINIVVAFVQALTDGLPKLIAAGAAFIITLLNGIASVLPQLITAAVNVIVTFVNGIADNIQPIVDSAVNLVTKFIGALVSTVFRLGGQFASSVGSIAGNAMSWLGNALSNGVNAAGNIIRGLWDKVVGAVRWVADGVGSAASSIGTNIVNGIRNAINNGVQWVRNAVSNLANSVMNTLKGILGIHSPSRVMYTLGEYVVQGFANAIYDGESDTKSAAMSLALAARDGVKMGSKILTDPNFAPKIKPVVDMSNVRNSASALQSMLGNGYNMVAGLNVGNLFGSSTGSNGNITNNYNFNQTNNSSTSLDYLQIYQNTKSQIAMFKGAMS